MQAWRGQVPWPTYSKPQPPTVAERFWAKVDLLDGPEGCWRWTASRYRNGYGQFDGGVAHRFSYELHHGPIPDGLVIDHLCGQRYCVNPKHLELVTHAVNTQRGYSRNISGTHRRDLMAKRTHCKHGHQMTEPNTYVTKQGWRQCRTCRNERRTKHVA